MDAPTFLDPNSPPIRLSNWLCGGLYPCQTSARNYSGVAKDQPILIANQCGRSICDREKSKPAFSI